MGVGVPAAAVHVGPCVCQAWLIKYAAVSEYVLDSVNEITCLRFKIQQLCLCTQRRQTKTYNFTSHTSLVGIERLSCVFSVNKSLADGDLSIALDDLVVQMSHSRGG